MFNRVSSKLATSTNTRFFTPLFPTSGMLRINPSVQLHKCQISDPTKKLTDCFVLMHDLRKDDVFLNGLSKQKMVNLFFPKTTSDMALSLSNVTSAFYGVMLQSTGKILGMQSIDAVSKDFFYDLGRTKTRLTSEAINGKYDLPKDARGVGIILISAIYNASPEYKFHVNKFDSEHCEIDLKGIDRYYRITKTLGIEQHLQWPVLHNFMRGINDQMKAGMDIKSEMLSIEDSGECHERFSITRKGR